MGEANAGHRMGVAAGAAGEGELAQGMPGEMGHCYAAGMAPICWRMLSMSSWARSSTILPWARR